MGTRRKLSLILAVLLILSVFAGCGKTQTDSEPQDPTVATEAAVKRQLREGVQTVLLSCTETYERSEQSAGFRNANRANFMMLLVIDEQNGTITPVQINPDSAVSFSVSGKPEKVEIPAGMAFSYGSGGSDSSLNLLSAVSGLLGGVKIDHYLSFTMDAVAMVNDALDGVSVSDPAYFVDISEESVRLSGPEAVAFFSFRDDADVTNEARMGRQHQYMRAIYGPFMAKADDEDFLSNLLLRLGDNMATDLTLSQLILMFETFEQYAMEEEVIVIKGRVESSGDTTRYIVDGSFVEEALGQLIFE